MKRTLSLLAFAMAIAVASGCSSAPRATPTAQSAAESTRAVSVSGRVVPGRWAALSFHYGGRLTDLHVREGQKVAAGQELAALDHTDADLGMRVAAEALAVRKADLARAQAAPMASDLLAARASVEAARSTLHVLESAPQARDLEEARLQVEIAKNALWATQLEGNVPGLPISAQQAARARAAASEQSLHIAELQYERVRSGATADALAGARASLATAQAALESLERGASPAELDGLRAASNAAQVALEQAQCPVMDAQLVAPFAGTVTQVSARVAEHVGPGSPVLILADLDTLRVETTDLDQTDLGVIRVGQRVDLTFDALPGEVLRAKVTRIADATTSGQGGTSFTLTIELDSPDARLRWGMTAFADIIVQ